MAPTIWMAGWSRDSNWAKACAKRRSVMSGSCLLFVLPPALITRAWRPRWRKHEGVELHTSACNPDGKRAAGKTVGEWLASPPTALASSCSVDDSQITRHGLLDAFIQCFTDQGVADGDLKHAGYGRKEGTQVDLAQIMPCIHA